MAVRKKPSNRNEINVQQHFPLKKWIGLIKNYLLSRIGLNRYWLRELRDYYQWKSEQEFYSVYQRKRKEVAKLWKKKERRTEGAIRSFYKETDYFILRQMFIHKNNCFPEIADFIPKDRPVSFCEYGSGVGPVTKWLIPRFSNINFTLVDLDSPTLNFAKWRFEKQSKVKFMTVPLHSFPLKKTYDLICCLAVMEHVSQPLALVKHFIKHLKTGGTLFIDFQYDEDENENLLKSQAQRNATIDYLNHNLKIVWALDKNWRKDGGFGQYIKSP